MRARHIVLTVFSVLLLCFSVFAAITYQQGYYDFTFIDRPGKTSSSRSVIYNYINFGITPETEPENTSPETEPEPPETEPEETGHKVDVEPEVKKTYREVIEELPTVSELKREGYRRTDEAFSSKMLLARLETPGITYNFSNCTETVEIPEQRENFVGGYTTYIVTAEVPKPAVKLYYGLIYYDDTLNGHVLCDSDFNGIYRNFDCREFVPVYYRDYGDPVFLAKGEYYYINLGGTSPAFSLAFDMSRLNVSLRCDVPSYFFPPANELKPFLDEEKNLWGYRNDNDEVVIEPQYFAAYDFNENGLAAVVTQANKLVFINNKNEVKIEKYEKTFYKNQRKAIVYYLPPDTNGLESLGMFYFDRYGLCRVRVQVHDEDKGDQFVIDDYSVLIDANGNEYRDIPVGFNIVSYSDGVILLEKNGLYGYYDLHSKWVAQPKYTYATPFVEGVAVVGTEDGKRALIDTKGNILLDFVFDYISMPSAGVIAAYEIDNGWTIYQKMGM